MVCKNQEETEGGRDLHCTAFPGTYPYTYRGKLAAGRMKERRQRRARLSRVSASLSRKSFFFFTNILALLRSSDIKAAYCRKKGRVVIRTDIRH